jgi:AraC-like DNA-binding protein
MAGNDMSIRKTDITTESRVRHAHADGPGMHLFAACGLASMGIDDRVAHETWGEGLGPTRLYFLVTGGEVTYTGETQPVVLGPGDLLAVPPHCQKWFRTGGAPVRAVWFHFHESPCTLPPLGGNPLLLLCPEPGLADAAMETLLRRSGGGEEISRQAAGLLLTLLRVSTAPGHTTQEDPLRGHLARLWDEVNARPADAWDVEIMARLCGLCEGHFHRRCKALTGKTPMDMVRTLRMERAAFLLDTTTAAIESVALQVGYTSPYAFSEAFLRHHGLRPGAHRNRQ